MSFTSHRSILFNISRRFSHFQQCLMPRNLVNFAKLSPSFIFCLVMLWIRQAHHNPEQVEGLDEED